MASGEIVLVDDETSILDVQVDALRTVGLEARAFSSPLSAWEYIQRNSVALVVSDWNMPEMTGMDLLFKTRTLPQPPAVIMITAFGTVDRAVKAMSEGAVSFLEKPFQLSTYLNAVREALQRRAAAPVQAARGRRYSTGMGVNGPVFMSEAMQGVLDTARSAAVSDCSVLLLGESGTGKEVVADFIHTHSRRAAGALVKVNCGALPDHLIESELFGHEKGSFTGAERRNMGRFERAAGGTLFLDEIGDLPLPLQVKLLRAIQERTIERVGSITPIDVDFRLVCATHQDLPAAVAQGRFREDLFYRINVVPIHVPALRERKEDIEPLVWHFFRMLRTTFGNGPETISAEALEALRQFNWPGNIRQLRNTVECAFVLCRGKTIQVEDLPDMSQLSPPAQLPSAAATGAPAQPESVPIINAEGLRGSVKGVEAELILNALRANRWRVAKVARDLKISRSSLYERLKEYGIKRPGVPGVGEECVAAAHSAVQ